MSLEARPPLLPLPRLPFKDACPAGSLVQWHLWRSALLAVPVVNVLSLLQATSLLLRTVNIVCGGAFVFSIG